MQLFATSARARSSPGVTAAGRWRRRTRWGITAVTASSLTVSLIAAFTSTASAATPPPPARNVTPGAVASDSSHLYLFYTAGDGSVWAENVTHGASAPTAVGGHLISAPAPYFPGGSLGVFGEGPHHQLWDNSCDLFLYGCGSWLPLGGQITSKPGAVNRGSAGYSAYARGTHGKVWARDYTDSVGWGPWHSLGGQVLAGTGPTAAYLDGRTYVMVAGTNHELYIKQVGVTGWVPAGGQTSTSPALTAVAAGSGQPAALVGFARGTNGDAYYHRFNSASPGWHWMNGTFASGLAASDAVEGSTPTTYTYGVSPYGRIYEMTAFWNAYPPGLGVWAPVTG